ncbi:MAG: hypothetical protein QXI64_09745 [Sulfolobales archaeon]
MNLIKFRKECLEIVEREYYGKYGEDSKELCELEEKSFKIIYMMPVMAWLIVRYGDQFEAYPLIINPDDPRNYKFGMMSKAIKATIDLGYYVDSETLTLKYIDRLDNFYDIVGLLPARPDTYYIIGEVSNSVLSIKFVLGIQNLDDVDIDEEKEAEMTEAKRRAEKLKKLREKKKELLIEAYLEWLRDDTAKKYIDLHVAYKWRQRRSSQSPQP